MRVLLATGIFPPEIGGPAQYSFELSCALERAGHRTTVVTYGALKKLPPGLRHFLYALKLMPKALRADAVIAFDTYSTGAPALFVSALARRRLIVRVGGDFLWESYVARTGDLLPLPELYRHRERWGAKERLVFALARRVARRAHLAFTCEWLRDIWLREYGLDRARVFVVENAIPRRVLPAAPERKNFIMYGRQIALKNAPAFRRAFAAARAGAPDIVLEEGVLPHEALMEAMRACYAVALPSISDVTPNVILEAIAHGKPFLLTKYTGYADRFRDLGVIVDPLSEQDMTRGIAELADPAAYARLSQKIAAFGQVRTYETIAREFLALCA